VLVYACDHSGADALGDDNSQVIKMPCIGMLPPAFVDFVLSRGLADGVMLAGCANGDCYYRLGDQWIRERVAGERDPYLRKRVDRERVNLSWLPEGSHRRRAGALARFSASLETLPDKAPARRPRSE
jgi:coenzyme F420-reducing hydrogenase delta subunit